MFMLFGTSATNMSWRTPQMSLTGAPLSDYHTPFDDGMVAGPLEEQFELMDGEAQEPQNALCISVVKKHQQFSLKTAYQIYQAKNSRCFRCKTCQV